MSAAPSTWLRLLLKSKSTARLLRSATYGSAATGIGSAGDTCGSEAIGTLLTPGITGFRMRGYTPAAAGGYAKDTGLADRILAWPQPKPGGFAQAHGESMDACAGRHLDAGDIRKVNDFFGAATAYLQVVVTIDDLVGQTMQPRLPQEITKKYYEHAHTEQVRQRIPPKI